MPDILDGLFITLSVLRDALWEIFHRNAYFHPVFQFIDLIFSEAHTGPLCTDDVNVAYIITPAPFQNGRTYDSITIRAPAAYIHTATNYNYIYGLHHHLSLNSKKREP